MVGQLCDWGSLHKISVHPLRLNSCQVRMAVTSGFARKNSTTNPAATATSMQSAALVTAVHTPLLIEPVVRAAQPPAIPHNTKSVTITPTERIPECAHVGSHVSMATLSTS